MLRLVQLEYLKLRHTKYFWVLLSFFLLFLLSVPIGSKYFLDYLGKIGEEITDSGIKANELPLFDFVDIWQNLTWVYSNFSILLGFIVVISVCNEFSYGTIKQNVIDGLSRKEFLWSKVGFIISVSAIASAGAMVVGLIMGLLWSPVQGLPFIMKNIAFIPAYFLHLVAFQMFCLIVALLVKRSGMVLATLIFYIYVIEPIINAIVRYKYEMDWLADLLPMKIIGNVIPFPFAKYALMETQSYVGTMDLAILVIFLGLLSYFTVNIVTQRDLS